MRLYTMVIFWLLLENQGILGRLLLPASSQNIVDWNTEVFPWGKKVLSNQQKYGKSKWATNEVKKKNVMWDIRSTIV